MFWNVKKTQCIFRGRVLNFAIFVIFFHFAKFSTCKKFQNHKIAKLNICRVWDSPFPNVWSKYDIDTRTSHVSTYSNENRVLVTYSIIVTLIRNRKIKIQSDFRFLFLLNLWNKISAKCFAITKLWNAILINFEYLPFTKLSVREN